MTAKLRSSYARTNAMAGLYADIVEHHMSTFVNIEPMFLAAVDNEDHEESNKYHEAMRRSGIIVIVFSALHLEAGIYDFAAIHLGDNYTNHYLEKMDILAKWVVIPKLAGGKELRKDKAAYSCLKKLIKDRNELVHAKSTEFFPDEETLKRLADTYDEHDKGLREAVYNAFKTILNLSLELDLMFGPRYNILGSLANERFPEMPANLKPLVNKCKKAFK